MPKSKMTKEIKTRILAFIEKVLDETPHETEKSSEVFSSHGNKSCEGFMVGFNCYYPKPKSTKEI